MVCRSRVKQELPQSLLQANVARPPPKSILALKSNIANLCISIISIKVRNCQVSSWLELVRGVKNEGKEGTGHGDAKFWRSEQTPWFKPHGPGSTNLLGMPFAVAVHPSLWAIFFVQCSEVTSDSLKFWHEDHLARKLKGLSLISA